METKDEFSTKEALVNYKEIGDIIIKKLASEDYDELDRLFILREQELVKIKQLSIKNNQLKDIYEELKIESIDHEIRHLIDEKKKDIIKKYNLLEKKNNAAIKYKKSDNSYAFNLLNKKS